MQKYNKLSIVLYSPLIPGNTGTIGRTALAINSRLILIKPYGFTLDEKSLKRAGLDYWKHIHLTEYENWKQFTNNEFKSKKEAFEKIFLFSKKSSQIYYNAKFKNDAYLVFGNEINGLPDYIHKKYSNKFYKLPMFNSKIRSLNLSNAVTAVSFEAIRQNYN